MTNSNQEQQPRHYQLFLGAMDELENIVMLNNEEKNAVDEKRAKAFRDMRDYVWSSMTDEQRIGLTREALDNLEDQHAQRIVQAVTDFQAQFSRATAATTFYQYLEQIVGHEMPEKTLEQLMKVAQVHEKIKPEDRATALAFGAYQNFNDFAERYKEKGKAEGKLELQMERDAAFKGTIQAAKERFKDWSPQIQQFAAAVEASTLSYKLAYRTKEGDELIRTYALPGIEFQAKEAKGAYEKAIRDGRGVHAIVRDTLKSMKELPQKEFEQLYSIIYAAERGKLKTARKEDVGGYDEGAGIGEE